MIGIVIGSILLIAAMFIGEKLDDIFGQKESLFIKIIVGILGVALIVFFLGKRYGML